MLAVAVPNLESIIPLVGVTAGMLLAFVFPPILETIVFWRERKHHPQGRGRLYAHLTKNISLVMLGVVGLILGLWASTKHAIEDPTTPKDDDFSFDLNHFPSLFAAN